MERKELDHQLSEELIILEGLDTAVSKGWISEDEKQEWLNEYIDKRNAEPGRLGRACVEASMPHIQDRHQS